MHGEQIQRVSLSAMSMRVLHISLLVLQKVARIWASYFKRHAKKQNWDKETSSSSLIRHIDNRVVLHFLLLFNFWPPFQTSSLLYTICAWVRFHCDSSASRLYLHRLFEMLARVYFWFCSLLTAVKLWKLFSFGFISGCHWRPVMCNSTVLMKICFFKNTIFKRVGWHPAVFLCFLDFQESTMQSCTVGQSYNNQWSS